MKDYFNRVQQVTANDSDTPGPGNREGSCDGTQSCKDAYY